MSVATKEGAVPRFQKNFYFCCELLMLLHRESIANVVDFVVPVKPLFVGESDEAFDKFAPPYIDGSTGFVSAEHGFDCVNEGEGYLTLYETISSEVINTYC
jgi:hypothetical protein